MNTRIRMFGGLTSSPLPFFYTPRWSFRESNSLNNNKGLTVKKKGGGEADEQRWKWLGRELNGIDKAARAFFFFGAFWVAGTHARWCLTCQSAWWMEWIDVPQCRGRAPLASSRINSSPNEGTGSGKVTKRWISVSTASALFAEGRRQTMRGWWEGIHTYCTGNLTTCSINLSVRHVFRRTFVTDTVSRMMIRH